MKSALTLLYLSGFALCFFSCVLLSRHDKVLPAASTPQKSDTSLTRPAIHPDGAAGAAEEAESPSAKPDAGYQGKRIPAKIFGKVHSRTGEYHPSDLFFWFSPGVGVDTAYGASVEFRFVDSEWIGTFDTGPLWSGGYRLTVSKKADPYVIGPEDVIFRAGTEEVDLLCSDDVHIFDVLFRILDSGTGLPIEGASVIVERIASASFRVLQKPEPRSLRFPELLEGYAYHWIAFSPGYQVVTGDQNTLKRASIDKASGQIEVLLPRGWGAEFRVVDSYRQPLSNAFVTVDSRETFGVDLLGSCVLNRESPPSIVEVTCPGFAFTESSRHQVLSQLTRGAPIIAVRMRKAL